MNGFSNPYVGIHEKHMPRASFGAMMDRGRLTV